MHHNLGGQRARHRRCIAMGSDFDQVKITSRPGIPALRCCATTGAWVATSSSLEENVGKYHSTFRSHCSDDKRSGRARPLVPMPQRPLVCGGRVRRPYADCYVPGMSSSHRRHTTPAGRRQHTCRCRWKHVFGMERCGRAPWRSMNVNFCASTYCHIDRVSERSVSPTSTIILFFLLNYTSVRELVSLLNFSIR